MLPEKEQHLGFMANIYNEKALDFIKTWCKRYRASL